MSEGLRSISRHVIGLRVYLGLQRIFVDACSGRGKVPDPVVDPWVIGRRHVDTAQTVKDS